ncbi:hypothetical protein D3C72_2198580 [compost metagenome]
MAFSIFPAASSPCRNRTSWQSKCASRRTFAATIAPDWNIPAARRTGGNRWISGLSVRLLRSAQTMRHGSGWSVPTSFPTPCPN